MSDNWQEEQTIFYKYIYYRDENGRGVPPQPKFWNKKIYF